MEDKGLRERIKYDVSHPDAGEEMLLNRDLRELDGKYRKTKPEDIYTMKGNHGEQPFDAEERLMEMEDDDLFDIDR